MAHVRTVDDDFIQLAYSADKFNETLQLLEQSAFVKSYTMDQKPCTENNRRFYGAKKWVEVNWTIGGSSP